MIYKVYNECFSLVRSVFYIMSLENNVYCFNSSFGLTFDWAQSPGYVQLVMCMYIKDYSKSSFANIIMF